MSIVKTYCCGIHFILNVMYNYFVLVSLSLLIVVTVHNIMN